MLQHGNSFMSFYGNSTEKLINPNGFKMHLWKISRQSTVEKSQLWALDVVAVLALGWRTVEFCHITILQRFSSILRLSGLANSRALGLAQPGRGMAVY